MNSDIDFSTRMVSESGCSVLFTAIVANGEPLFEDGSCTGATLGKLLRNGQAG